MRFTPATRAQIAGRIEYAGLDGTGRTFTPGGVMTTTPANRDFLPVSVSAGIIQDLVGVPAEANTLATGMMTGLITNNKDPEKYGRVKVKFPWLSEEDESDWLRVVVPGGGNNRGLLFLPEVNDEVLVGFEQGDINRPYVLGGLWNGQDTPPESAAQLSFSPCPSEVMTPMPVTATIGRPR